MAPLSPSSLGGKSLTSVGTFLQVAKLPYVIKVGGVFFFFLIWLKPQMTYDFFKRSPASATFKKPT